MWEYSKKVIDHYEHPRNVGDIQDADGVGKTGSIICGDALKLSLKIKDGIIEDAKFKTFGCCSAIAAASALTEMIKGKNLDEASKITNMDIVNYLDGLPKEKMHCSVMGQEALEAAILNYRGIKPKKKGHDEGGIVCKCFGVTDTKIKQVARDNNLHTVEEITNYTKAGGGCGSCQYLIEEILDELWSKERKENIAGGKMTIVQKIKEIEKIFDEEIRPILRRDGGDIELVDVVENKVYVRLMGMCRGCQASVLTLKGLVEEKLKELLDQSLEVIQYDL